MTPGATGHAQKMHAYLTLFNRLESPMSAHPVMSLPGCHKSNTVGAAIASGSTVAVANSYLLQFANPPKVTTYDF